MKKLPLSDKLQITGILGILPTFLIIFKLYLWGSISAKAAVILSLYGVPTALFILITMAIWFREKENEQAANIPIPEKYSKNFPDNEAYVTRWRDCSVLVMNRVQRDLFLSRLDKVRDDTGGAIKFLKEEMKKVELRDDKIKLPEELVRRFENIERYYEATLEGLIVK